MRKSIVSGLILGLSVAGSAAAAEESEFLLYAVDQNSIAIELVNNANVSALQAEISIPGAYGAKTLGSACTASLPDSHQGLCTLKNGVFRLAVFSPSNATLPSGRIGTIDIAGGLGPKGLKVDKLLMGDRSARELPSTVLIDVGGTVDQQDFKK